MNSTFSRREFLRWTVGMAIGAPAALGIPGSRLLADEGAVRRTLTPDLAAAAKVAVVRCQSYGPEVRTALKQAFDLLGGIGSLVRNKTVTIKLNLTGTNFAEFLGRPVGETFMTHDATAMALTALLFDTGARRVRFIESTQSRAGLDATLSLADWDVNEFRSLGKVEFENTRNLGSNKSYSTLKVPTGGYMFSSFTVNRAYEDTDVLISLAKLKQHITAGVTLSMKNLFGMTPNSLYGDHAGSEGNEDATAGRGPLHNPMGFEKIKLPGLKESITSKDPTYRVPRIVADICAARPIHLAIVDGITSMSGGEGPWCRNAGPLRLTTPGVLIAGLNPVSTDAVGTAIMGYSNPRAARGEKPFHFCDNHLALAEQSGIGTADLAQIDVRGLSIEKARYPYKDTFAG